MAQIRAEPHPPGEGACLLGRTMNRRTAHLPTRVCTQGHSAIYGSAVAVHATLTTHDPGIYEGRNRSSRDANSPHSEPPGAPAGIVTARAGGAEILLGLAAPMAAIVSRRYALMLLGRATRGLGACAALFGVRSTPYR